MVLEGKGGRKITHVVISVIERISVIVAGEGPRSQISAARVRKCG
jgi:hypothetical protein